MVALLYTAQIHMVSACAVMFCACYKMYACVSCARVCGCVRRRHTCLRLTCNYTGVYARAHTNIGSPAQERAHNCSTGMGAGTHDYAGAHAHSCMGTCTSACIQSTPRHGHTIMHAHRLQTHAHACGVAHTIHQMQTHMPKRHWFQQAILG